MAMDPALTNTYATEGPRGHQGATPVGNQGEREDLSDVIARIDPAEVPFYSNSRKGGCDAILTEWLVQELAAADTGNKQPEGFEAAFDPVTVPVRFGNYTQILARTALVSGTMDVVDKAGRSREIAYQRVLKGLEMRRDLDAILTADQAKDGSTSTRALASFSTWVTNGSAGATGSMPTGDGSDTFSTGTGRPASLDLLDAAMEACYIDGGQPTVLYMHPTQKRLFSDIEIASPAGTVANQYNMSSVRDAVYIGSVSVYLTDFGRLDVAVDRFMPNDRYYGVDTRYWECCTLPGRSFMTSRLSTTGDSEKHLVLWEGTARARAPKAHFAVFDLNTS